MKSETRKIDRTPEDMAHLTAIREKFQKEKPALKKLVETGDAAPPMPLGTYVEIHLLLHRLKTEREAAGMSLADVAERTGMDRAAISRLENGHQPNRRSTLSPDTRRHLARVSCGRSPTSQ